MCYALYNVYHLLVPFKFILLYELLALSFSNYLFCLGEDRKPIVKNHFSLFLVLVTRNTQMYLQSS